MTDHVFIVVGLLLTGYVLVALEVFVVPGFGAPGIAGLICLILACGLALRYFGAIGGGGLVAGVIVLTTVMAVLLPRTPFGKWTVHRKDLREATTAVTGLTVGDPGVSETVLRPAGIARFGDRRESVVTRGEFIEAGTIVTVVELEGLRVVVEVPEPGEDE